MVENKEAKQAELIINQLCKFLDSNDLVYDCDEEQRLVKLIMRGEDLPITMCFKAEASKGVLFGYSNLDFAVPKEKRYEMAVAATAVNYVLAMGNFDFDLTECELSYRMSLPYLDSVIGIEAIKTMFFCILSTVEQYNDKFYNLSKGVWDLGDFLGSFLPKAED